MTLKRPQSSARKPRSDAQRNRKRILEVAKQAFTRSGANASLDEIAKKAGVGPGTLYRHFPSRDELLEAVYRTEVEKLAEAEARFSRRLTPIKALRAWMMLFVDYIATKKIIAPALNASVGGTSKAIEDSYTPIHQALRALLDRAVKSGELRKDIEPMDLLRALVGVAYLEPNRDWEASARRLVDILIAGSQP